MKILVREGWPDKETGKKGDARIQFQMIQYLQDVLPQFAKKLTIQMDIKTLKENLISDLSILFKKYQGNQTVTFEVMEFEKIETEIAVKPIEIPVEDDLDMENLEDIELEIEEPKPEIRVLNQLQMPSRKLKIQISNELLSELEKNEVDFRLN